MPTSAILRAAAPTRATWIALGSALALTACELPTSLPIWETRWVIPAENTTIPVTSLVPGAVTVNSEKTEFIFSASAGPIARSLGQFCAPCVALDGMTVPKPAFTVTFLDQAGLPGNVDSLTLTRGTIDVRFTNGLGFDPIRPSAAEGAARGSILVTLRTGSTVLGTHTIDGATRSLAPGAVVTETVSLDAAVLPRTIGDPIVIEITLTSPEGDAVVVNTAQTLSIEAAQVTFAMSEAKVEVINRPITSTAVQLDLADLDSELTNRVQSGAVLLDIDNDFAVGGTLNATLTANGITYVRPVTLAPGETHSVLSFTREELLAIIGAPTVTLVVSGQVNADPIGLVRVTPAMQMVVESRLELYLSSEGGQ